MEVIAGNAANHIILQLMDYNTTVVDSSYKMYSTAYISNSSNTPSFSSIVEFNMPLSAQVVIHV